MIGILLQLLLMAQGIPVLPNQGGTVTGVLTTEASRPATGIRVAVMVLPESPTDVANSASLVSIAETDDSGRFQLEAIPPGRYFITAGRVELPTYYPGTLEVSAGRSVEVRSGVTLEGVNFVMKDVSDRGLETFNALLRIPIRVHVDGGAIPIFSDRGKVRIRLTQLPGGMQTDVHLDSPTLTMPMATGEFHVAIENLPDGYAVTSLNYGSINLLNDPLKIALADLPRPGAGEKMFLTTTQTGIVMQRRVAVTAPTPQVAMLGSITSNSDLTVTLSRAAVAPPPVSGVQVRGKVEYPGQQEVYISGVPGTLYADGRFEFRGVPAGLHVVAMLGESATSREFGAVIFVGTTDVEDVQLRDTIVLPLDVMTSAVNRSGATVDPASARLYSIHGHVEAEATHMPIAGIVTLRGHARPITYSLPADGEFEIPNLLPGSYGLRIETFDRSTITRTIVVGNEDLDLRLSVP